MNRIAILILLVILTVACRRDPMPRNAIPREQYINVMVDVHIAEALYRDRFRLRMDTLRSSPLYLSVLEKHGVSENQMTTTLLYYSRHPREYDKIYAEVLSKLSLLIEEENQREELIIN